MNPVPPGCRPVPRAVVSARLPIGLLTAVYLFLTGCPTPPTPIPPIALLPTGSQERSETGPTGPPARPADTPSIHSIPTPPSEDDPLASLPSSPEPPMLSPVEAGRRLRQLLPPPAVPLTRESRPLLYLHDLQGDGEPEGFALAVRATDPAVPAEADVSALSDLARLYAEGTPPLSFSLLVLSNSRGELRLSRIIPLGDWRAFEGFRIFPVNSGESAPLAVSATFLTPEGEEERLFVFSSASRPPLCRVDLRRSIDTHSDVRDIDGDGVVDLFVQERGLEEGTGMETFLTWHRWNGTCFVPYRTVNVVRNLNAFLKRVGVLLVEKNYRELVRRALDPHEVRLLRADGLDDRAIVYRALDVQPPESDGPEEELREVIVPEILENPFSLAEERGSRFRLVFRLLTSGGGSYLAEPSLLLPANPFGERQFVFTIDDLQ